MNYEFMNMINTHLENQRMYATVAPTIKENKISENKERIIHEIIVGLAFLTVFLLDTPH